ncbi:MAG TPA: 2-C-methyl-D-erythritol 4-phosphate cytidylyltransferase [Streptosporangiaceae bacterium]|jgi:2-C-methyl-D-erythritol 4-phosphate cytidylyltransferase
MTATAELTVGVVLAGGIGRRVGGPVPKQLLHLAGRPIIEHSIDAFEAADAVDEVLVVMAPDFVDEARKIVAARGYSKVTRVLAGGAERTESTARALAAIGDAPDATRVLLHDAVRPLVPPPVITACAQALGSYEAVAVAVPSSDTVVVVDGDVIVATPDRATLRRQQTPQGFRLGTLRAAYARALADPAFTATDDCGVVLRYLPGVPIHVVPGSEDNIKITHPGDLAVAERLLRLREES